MKPLMLLAVALACLLLAACGEDGPAGPTPVPSSTATPTPSPAATATPIPTATMVLIPTPTPTATVAPFPTPSPTTTAAPIPMPSPTPTPPPAVPTPTPSPTQPAVQTPTPTPTQPAVPTPTPSPTPTVVPTPTPSPVPCPATADPDWWIPEPHYPPIASYIAYKPPALEHLLYYSDIVVHASLASVSTRTASHPASSFFFDEADVPAGKTPAPICRATLELRFEVTDYLKGTGATEVVVEIPLRADYLENRLVHYHRLEEEAQAAAAAWWSLRSPLSDDRKAVLFLKFNEGGEQFLSFTDRAWDASWSPEGPQAYERSWLPEVGQDFIPPPASYGETGELWERVDDNEVPLTGDGSAPRFLSASGLSREGPTPVIISLADLRSRTAAFEAVLAKGRDVPGYSECIETVLWFEQDARYRGKPWFPYEFRIAMPSGLPAGTVVARSNHYRHRDIVDYHDTWLDGPDKELFEVMIVDDDDSPTNAYYELLSAVRPLPFGDYEIERYYVPHTDTLCPDFMPNGFTFVRFGEWTISVEASIAGLLHEAFFDPDASASAVGFSASEGVLRPAVFTVSGATTTIRSLQWRDGAVSMRLEPYVPLTGYVVDIVDPDGSARLTLPIADAVVNRTNGTLTWQVPDQPWRAGDRLMLRIRPEGPVPLAPGPRPWVPEVLNLTATVGTETVRDSSLVSVTLEWDTGDAVYQGNTAHPEVQLWDGGAREWREPFDATPESNAPHRSPMSSWASTPAPTQSAFGIQGPWKHLTLTLPTTSRQSGSTSRWWSRERPPTPAPHRRPPRRSLRRRPEI